VIGTKLRRIRYPSPSLLSALVSEKELQMRMVQPMTISLFAAVRSMMSAFQAAIFVSPAI
jgi:hypothetical protein